MPKEKWSKEKTIQRIAIVEKEFKELCREINKINRQISGLTTNKNIVQKKASKKAQYLNQLTAACMSSGTCTHFQISYTAYVPLLIHGVSCSTFLN